MSDDRAMLRHFLAALAYRTQKALQDAPTNFGEFRAGHDVRTPADLVRHMTSVLGYARMFFVGGQYRAEPLPSLAAEIERFHEIVADVAAHLARGTELRGVRPEQLLQGPFADAMTHAGQLAMLRRLAGAPASIYRFTIVGSRHLTFVSMETSDSHPPTLQARGSEWREPTLRRLARQHPPVDAGGRANSSRKSWTTVQEPPRVHGLRSKRPSADCDFRARRQRTVPAMAANQAM